MSKRVDAPAAAALGGIIMGAPGCGEDASSFGGDTVDVDANGKVVVAEMTCAAFSPKQRALAVPEACREQLDNDRLKNDSAAPEEAAAQVVQYAAPSETASQPPQAAGAAAQLTQPSKKSKKSTASKSRRKPAAATSRRVSSRARPPKRRRKQAEQVLDPTLFVGYVEEFETPEMIEMKFKKLEEIEQRLKRDREQAAAAATAAAAENDDAEAQTLGAAQGQPESAASASDDAAADQRSESAGSEGADAEACSTPPNVPDEPMLDRAALLEVFKQTSNFTVETAQRQHAMGDDEYMYDDGWDMGHVTTHETHAGDRVFLFGDGTDDELWDELFGKKKRARAPRAPQMSNRTTSVSKIVANGVMHVAFVADTSGRFVTGLKKIRMLDPNAIMYTRIPKEITPSWAKRVEPYRPKAAVHRHTTWRPDEVCLDEDTFSLKQEAPPCAKHVRVNSVLDTDLLELLGDRAPLEGIVLSPPWKHARKLVDDDAGQVQGGDSTNPNNLAYGIEPEDLLKLKLNRKGLLPSGFVYVWTPKHLILRVLRALEKMDLHYVENAVYVKQHVHNEFYCESSPYFRQSKDTLLICRKGKKNKSGKIAWSKVEIRHQRTSDVHFEFLRRERPDGGPHLYAHSYVQNMAETMLPHARFNPLPKADLSETPPAASVEVASKGNVAVPAGEELQPEAQQQHEASQQQHQAPQQQQQAPQQQEEAPQQQQEAPLQQQEATQQQQEAPQEGFVGEGPGKLLHLWAPAGRQRTGWVTVSETSSATALNSQ